MHEIDCSVSLPSYPKVIVDGKTIIIIDEDGKKQIWDEAIDPRTAESIAHEIELGLKSIVHVRNGLLSYLGKATDELLLSEVSLDDLEWIIGDAYNDVFRVLDEYLAEISYRVRNR